MAVLFTDNFNRANESPLGGNWATAEGGGLQLISNAVGRPVASVTNTVSIVTTTAATIPANQYAQATILGTAGSTFDYPGIALRFSSTGGGTGYVVAYGNLSSGTQNIFTVWKVVSGTYTQIGSDIAATYIAGGILYAEAVNSGTSVNINVYYNGTLIGTRTDTSSIIASGQPGLFYYFGNTGAYTLDDFSTGNVGYNYVGSATTSPTTSTNTISYTMGSKSNLAVLYVYTSVGGGAPYPTAALTNNSGQLVPVYGTYGTSSSYIALSAPFSSQFFSAWYYVPGTDASAPTSFTFTFNGGTPGQSVISIVEYSGISSSSPLIATAGSPNLQSSPGTGTGAVLTNTQTVGTVPSVIIGFSLDNGGPAFTGAGTGYTFRANIGSGSIGIAFADLRATSTGSQQASFTTTHGTDSFLSLLLAFAEPSTVVLTGTLGQWDISLRLLGWF